VTGDWPGYVEEADLGVLADRMVYEGLLGSKNRVLQWMGAGLPVLYNRLGDLGDLLADRALGLTFTPGDSGALAERLAWAAGHDEELRRMAAGPQVAQREPPEARPPLVEWAGPRRAPDAGTRHACAGRRPRRWRQRARASSGGYRACAERGLVRLWRRFL
jgi:glycosyltransferase involved in cell wall biosynthesis